MKKTTTINLNGAVIHIDEDAYQQLAEYLDNLKGHFAGEKGAEEILGDIESRIGDLFKTRLRYGIEVVALRDVNEVIEIMGQPEDFDCDVLGEGEADAHQPSETGPTIIPSPEVPPISIKREKTLFRDPDSAYLGGVASGLGWYLGIDAVWVRLLLIILTFFYGASILVYLLFWVIVPQARTTPQKMQMKGEPVTVDTITQNIKKEEKERSSEPSLASGGGSSVARTVLRIIFVILAVIIGTVVILFLLPALLLLIPMLFLGANLFDLWVLPGVSSVVPDFSFAHALAGSIPLILGLVFVLGIPLLALLRVILVNLTNGVFSKTVNWMLVIGWIVGLALLVVGSLHTFVPLFNQVNFLHI